MLVLSRKTKQSIMMGDNIEVTVLGVTGGRVRLGIAAPEHVRILRSELQSSSEPAVLSEHPDHAILDQSTSVGDSATDSRRLSALVS